MSSKEREDERKHGIPQEFTDQHSVSTVDESSSRTNDGVEPDAMPDPLANLGALFRGHSGGEGESSDSPRLGDRYTRWVGGRRCVWEERQKELGHLFFFCGSGKRGTFSIGWREKAESRAQFKHVRVVFPLPVSPRITTVSFSLTACLIASWPKGLLVINKHRRKRE